MELPYTLVLKRDGSDSVIARVKELEGCVADGQDELDAIANLTTMKELWFSAALEAGQPIPMPEVDEQLPSGKFLTRLPRSLHKALIDLAEYEGVSLNQLVLTALTDAAGRKAAFGSPSGAIAPTISASTPDEYQSLPKDTVLKLVHSTSGKKVVDDGESTEWTDRFTPNGTNSFPARRSLGAY